MAGNLTVEECGSVFAPRSREASANYGIGTDGRLACYVEDEDAAWTSASWTNDNMAITVEVANTDEGVANGTWEVSDAAWKTLVELAVYVCKRYGFRLHYDGTPNGSLTEHRMFAQTACPGPYLHDRMGKLAAEVNARLDGEYEDEEDEMAVWTYKNKAMNGEKDTYQLLTDIHEALCGPADKAYGALYYRNGKLEKVDVYQILRDCRDYTKDIWDKVRGM